MKFIRFSHSQLKILASFFTDLSAAWFLTLFGTRNVFMLTITVAFSIVSLILAFKIQGILDDKK